MRIFGTSSDGVIRVVGPSGDCHGTTLWEHYRGGEHDAVKAAVAICQMTGESQDVLIEGAVLRLERCDPPVTVVGWIVARKAAKHSLTRREIEVLSFMEQGLDNKQTAAAMDVVPGTVRNYKKSIHQKLGVTSDTAAVGWAIRNGLI